MALIMLKCPKTGKELQVGFPIPRADFDAARFERQVYGPCPGCGRMHLWSKADVTLKE
jgi:hypothetical protein